MDVASLLTLLLLALALAIQPWSLLAAVLLVTSEGGVAKTMAYVSGWVLALAAVAIVTIAVYPQTPKAASSSTWTSWVEIASGVALGGWLLLRSRRPVAAQPAGTQPKWMSRLDSMSPLPAFVLGAFLPNYAIVVAAVSNVVQAGLSQGPPSSWWRSSSWPQPELPHLWCCWCSAAKTRPRSIKSGESG
jgi:hypothetical protein